MSKELTIFEKLEELIRFGFDVNIAGGYGIAVTITWLSQDPDTGGITTESETSPGDNLYKLITKAYYKHVPKQFRRASIGEILQSATDEVNSWPVYKQRLARHQSILGDCNCCKENNGQK